MEIQPEDILLKVRSRTNLKSPPKVLAKIMATGEIWIDPYITFPECHLALGQVLEAYVNLYLYSSG